MNHARMAAVSAAVLAALALAGCGGPLILEFRGADRLNLNDKDECVPVEVRVFLLKDKGSFAKASFEQLWGAKYKEVLGTDVVGEPRPITIFASKATPLNLGELPKEVRFIGVMAMYQRKAEEGMKRHVVVDRDEAGSQIFELIEYRLELKKK